MGGLATAIRLRIKGYEVHIYEAQAATGGKLAELNLEGFRFDMGPSLFTLPEELDNLFCLAGKDPRDYFSYSSLEVLAHYFFEDGTFLKAYADPRALASEVEAQLGEPAQNTLKFLSRAAEMYEITHHVFLERSLHKLSTYLRKETLQSLLRFHRLKAFSTMHGANAHAFSDKRTVQLFDRYATYNGSDPYQAPATLNVIPHLEHNVGGFFPKEGIYSLAKALTRLAKEIGVQIHLNSSIEKIWVEKQRVKGVMVQGQRVAASHVVSNMDVVPTYRKLLSGHKAPNRILNQPRSSSALIFYWGINRTFAQLNLHNIFFSADYQAEFDYIWKRSDLYEDPTVYVYISSKSAEKDAPRGMENWFVMINVPANTGQDWDALMEFARAAILNKLSRLLGTPLESHIVAERVLDPRGIELRTSSFQGALYGSSSNAPFAAFLRHPNFSRKIEGLYFVGGSVHPGGGIPLCLLSARIVDDLIAPAS